MSMIGYDPLGSTNLATQVQEGFFPLRPHYGQSCYWRSPARFNVVPPGRRSGKSELAKRKLVVKSLYGVPGIRDPRFFAGAPTRNQAKEIYWADLKHLTKKYQSRRPNESQLIIYLINGAELHVLGMDRPERVEGRPWDGGILDEYGNMKAKTWLEHVRPALSTPGRPPGWCDFIGVPEGRNHYYKLYKSAKARNLEFGSEGGWATYHWISADILDPAEIEAAQRDMDPLSYQQEYEGSFINFTGRAYYPFDENLHCTKLEYNPKANLNLCFDFNISPGIAVAIQEQNYVDPKTFVPLVGKHVSGIIDEVWIPQHSNTIYVCNKLIEKFKDHKGYVVCYGDASGGHGGSAKVQGSDWELIEKKLRPVFNDQLHFQVKGANPGERARVNAVNSRLLNTLDQVHMQVDPSKAPHTVEDFEGVIVIEGGTGELNKKDDLERTHLTDAVGYYCEYEWPIDEAPSTIDIMGI